MPYNTDFEIPTDQAVHRPISAAPKGSLYLPVMGACSLIGWRSNNVGRESSPIAIEITCYGASDIDPYPDDGDVGLIFEAPQFFVQPATAYPISDHAARSPGDIVTNGDVIAIIGATSAGQLLSFNLRSGSMDLPLVGYPGWRMFVNGQHIFTKLP